MRYANILLPFFAIIFLLSCQKEDNYWGTISAQKMASRGQQRSGRQRVTVMIQRSKLSLTFLTKMKWCSRLLAFIRYLVWRVGISCHLLFIFQWTIRLYGLFILMGIRINSMTLICQHHKTRPVTLRLQNSMAKMRS